MGLVQITEMSSKIRQKKLWRISPKEQQLTKQLSQELAISPIVAQVLINRGIRDTQNAKNFLNGGAELLASPWLLSGMEQAVGRIQKALTERQKIVIYGDYDVDGITSTALLFTVLTRLGATVDYYIPERQTEGYGLNKAALENINNSGSHLVITVDCGISAVDEVEALADKMDIIITDHHQPPQLLPSAYAIINPKLANCEYPDKNLAGVGVAFKLAQALWQKIHDPDVLFQDYLDLVAVGTIADVAPIVGENRIMVKMGLNSLNKSPNVGLKALVEACGLLLGDIDAGKIGFVIGPRLNAAGRVSHAAIGVELLTTENSIAAERLANDLEEENRCRQAVEKSVLTQAQEQLKELDLTKAKVLVLAGDGWHTGVIGIVASRLVEQYYRPVVMIGVRDGIGKGSCRSIPGFDMYQALEACRDVLLQYGGHTLAAGLSVAETQIDALRQKLNKIAAEWLTEKDYQPVLSVDACIALQEINDAFIEQLHCLAPHGIGNPSPVFCSERLDIADIKKIGQEGRHLRLKVSRPKDMLDVVAWNMGDLVPEIAAAPAVDLAFVPEYNEWQGQKKIQLKARDIMIKNDVPNHVSLLDARNDGDKIAYCLERARSGKTLILVGTRKQAVKLARKLRQVLPAGHKIVACYHETMSIYKKDKVNQRWTEGTLELVVTMDASCFTMAKTYIVYNTSRQTFNRLCQYLAAAEHPVSMHFLFNSIEEKQAWNEADISIPNREAVAKVYWILKEKAKKYDEIELLDRQIAASVHQLCNYKISTDAVAAAVTILEELNLIAIKQVALRRMIRLLAVPKEKLSIESSRTFRDGIKIKNDLVQFYKELSGSSVIKLWQKAVTN
ncbi:MAG: single-stranded-DNA-specific exonuclease RecJ [Firmicutes bacterium]|nr:single-stranded-DNA-specific exonuclease RecJ [Bacillota bacterium]